MKRHIMAIGDGPFSGTGFSEELKNIMFRLVQSGDYEVSWQSLQHIGYPIDMPNTVFPELPKKPSSIRLYGTYGDQLSYGASAFVKNYRAINPDLVFFMGDPKNIRPYEQYKMRLGFPLVFYVTLDGTPISPAWGKNIKIANLPVAMTEWASNEYKKIGIHPAWIHHGVNCKWMSITEKEKIARKKQIGLDEDVVVFSNWDIPQFRKRPDALLRCWKEFMKKPRKAILNLYSDWNMEMSLGFNIMNLAEQYGVSIDTIIDPITIQGSPKIWMSAERPDTLKANVGFGDVYLSTTSGEGFGKCGLDAMAMRMAVVITDYSACSEVHAKGSILVPCYEGRAGRYRCDDRRRSVEGGIVNEEKFVEAMIYLYEDENERRKLQKEARRWAKTFDYDKVIIPQWKRLLGGLDTEALAIKELLQI